MRRTTLLLVLAAFVCSLTLAPTAVAATYNLDPVTGHLVATLTAKDESVYMARGAWDAPAGTLRVCGSEESLDCWRWMGVKSIDVHFAKPNQTAGIILDDVVDTNGAPIPITLSGVDQTGVQLECNLEKPKKDRACSITAAGTGIDVNKDETPDITLVGTSINVLNIRTGPGPDRIDTTRFTFPINPYRFDDNTIDWDTKIDTGAGNDTITTGKTRDMIGGGTGTDTIKAGAGNDSAGGGIGNDTTYGGPGNDRLSEPGWGNDTTYGGPGNDDINTERGRDIVHSGPGNDGVTHFVGSLMVRLGPGNDMLLHTGGPLSAFGGPGKDEFNVNTTGTTGTNAHINCGPGYDKTNAPFPHRTHCEFVYFPDIIVGR